MPASSLDEKLAGWDGAELEDEEVTDVLATLHPIGGGSVRLDLGNISQDGGVVLDGVGDEHLDKLLGVRENASPFLDSGDVTLHAFAILEVLGELLNNSNHDLDTGNNVTNVSLLEVSDSLGDLFLESGAVSEALLDLWEVVAANHTFNDTSEELSNILWSDAKGLSDKLNWGFHGWCGGDDSAGVDINWGERAVLDNWLLELLSGRVEDIVDVAEVGIMVIV